MADYRVYIVDTDGSFCNVLKISPHEMKLFRALPRAPLKRGGDPSP
jgi:hypothetical protein